MKKLLFGLMLVSALSVNAQNKETKDTTIALTMSINQFRALLGTIDALVDSKKASKELIEFLSQNAKMLNPVKEEPLKKEQPKKN